MNDVDDMVEHLKTSEQGRQRFDSMKPVANDKSGIDPVVMLSASADVAMANKKASEGAANEA